MSMEYRMNHSHSQLSQEKNENLAQLHLFFPSTGLWEAQVNKSTLSLISVVSMQEAGDRK